MPLRYFVRPLGFFCIGTLLQPTATAQDLVMEDLLEMDISQLMQIDISISSRYEERQFTLPAASYIITREDIQRSGLQSLPELMRLVPGFQVGKIDANKWGINSRKTSSQFAGSMLVLMDGRTLYNPLFAGTRWGEQDYLLEDIERIEVIRGPGGASWGANAVDGIINIITRSAEQSQGVYLSAGGGIGETRSDINTRYGFAIDKSTHLRIYEKTRRLDRGEYLDDQDSNNNGYFPVGQASHDDGRLSQTGFRLDKKLASDQSHFTLQGDYYSGKLHDIRDTSFSVEENSIDVSGGNLLSRWSGRLSSNSNFNLQAYVDQSKRADSSFIDEYSIADIDFQHMINFDRHAFSWSINLRRTSDKTSNPSVFALLPSARTDRMISAFIQDRWEISKDKLWLTAGLKEENNDYTGNEYQPSLNLSWAASPRDTLWTSFSRVVRTPSRGDHNAVLDFGDGTFIPVSDPDMESKVVRVSEIGYRGVFAKHTLLEATAYYNKITDQNIDPNTAVAYRARGIEINTHHDISAQWKLEFWLAYQQLFEQLPDTLQTVEDRLIRSPTAHLRSYWNISPNWQFDTLLYYADNVKNSAGEIIHKNYNRLDLHIGWQARQSTRLDISLSNLLDDVHAESGENTRINTGVRRGIYTRLSVNF